MPAKLALLKDAPTAPAAQVQVEEVKSKPAEEVPCVHEDESDAIQMETASAAEISKPLPVSDKQAPWKPFDRACIAATATRARMAELMPPPRGSAGVIRRESRGGYLSSSNDASASESDDAGELEG